MSTSHAPERLRRGPVLIAIAVVALVALVIALFAVLGDDGEEQAATTGGAAKSTKVEVFSWWTGGGEAAGLNALIDIWNTEQKGVEFENAAVAGGAGSNAKAVLAQRLGAGDPPDSFQGHAGAELQDYIDAGQLEPLNDLFAQQGWNDVFPQQLLDQITVAGNIYSVPVNIHRANMLWFSPAVLRDAGVTAAPATMDEWIAAMGKVKAAGKLPLALGEQWTVKHLLETVLLADLGTDGYAALWKAGGDWNSPQVTKALQDFEQILSYTNKDAASLTWQDASKLVADGEAAYNVMGDWAAGYYIELGKTAETDYGWAAVPGTDGVYQWLSDSFTLPKGAPHQDTTMEWLKLVGSKEGQDAFNPLKGSIPARTDADAAKYTGYLAWALGEWKNDQLAGSLTHGVVASNAWNTDIDTAIGLFLKDKDVAKFQSALATAAEQRAKT
jgi:glucose/mannose transport system substrate-binding protein